MTGEPYAYAGNNPTNNTDPTGLFRIPGTNICVDIADPNCNSIKEQHQEGFQKVADGAAGVLDTISGGNADLILERVPGDQSTKVRWGSNSFQVGRVAGHSVAALNLPAYLGSTTYGAAVNGFDTTLVCMMGRGGRACGADVAGAWFGFFAPLGAGRAGAFFGSDVSTGAGLFADIFSTAVANGIDTFRRC